MQSIAGVRKVEETMAERVFCKGRVHPTPAERITLFERLRAEFPSVSCDPMDAGASLRHYGRRATGAAP